MKFHPRNPTTAFMTVLLLATCPMSSLNGQQKSKPYRLNAVDLKQPVIWQAQSLNPEGSGLAFGGQDQRSEDARPHTRLLDGGQWKPIDRELRDANPFQKLHVRIWRQREKVKNILARCRFVFFQGLETEDEPSVLKREIFGQLLQLKQDLATLESDLNEEQTDQYARGQFRFARTRMQLVRKKLQSLGGEVSAGALENLRHIQIQLELAADAFAAEPPPRAMNCGTARLPDGAKGPSANTIVYDPKSKLYVIFGGDHLDYLSNDLWVFDPAKRRWFQRHPAAAPIPRANHRLELVGDGTIRMTGGYTYSSNTDYVGGQYIDISDGPFTYDVEKDQWRGDNLVEADTRVYRSGPFRPEFYQQGPRPDAAKFAKWLDNLPTNEWLPTHPPFLPRLNRDWGTARIDPARDMILRWSGGHSAHGGTDVLHFHFSTNRWELPFPVEFPLGQLYSNTSYPNGFNFNLRPWMTGHTYQNYDYDPPSKKMIKAGRPRHYYVYDPDAGDWIGRGTKPEAMQYNSCFYTLTLTATPQGVICWDKNGRVHRYDHRSGKWIELKLTGDKLPGAYVDNSSIAYDAQRNRVLMVNTLGYGKTFDGQVWALDLETATVKGLSPKGREQAVRFANVDKCCYDAVNDLLLMGTYLKETGDHTPTPAYDCRNNRWITLEIKYKTGERYGKPTREFPHRRSDGLMFDPKRKLIWGTDTNCQVYVLRLDLLKADVKPLD